MATAEREPTTGIGHTRWATHGRCPDANAHPHFDTRTAIHIVLNGIVENHAELRRRLVAEGADFTSETDAEVVAHLIASHHDGDLVEAVRGRLRRAARPLRLRRDVRRTSPTCSWERARSARSSWAWARASTSSPPPSPPSWRETRDVQLVEDDEIVAVRPDGAELLDAAAGAPIEREPEVVDWDEEAAEKGGYETFMLKEIHEQPDAVAETIADRLAGRPRRAGRHRRDDEELRRPRGAS